MTKLLKATANDDLAEAQTRDPSVQSPRLYHCTSLPSLDVFHETDI